MVTQLSIAVHEAGHVVARLSIGGPMIDSVSIIDAPAECSGIARMPPRWSRELANAELTGTEAEIEACRQMRQRWAYEDTVELLAGPIAECIHRYDRVVAGVNRLDSVELCLDGSLDHDDDFRSVRELLAWLHPEDRERQRKGFADAWEDALALLDRERKLWKELAQLLRERGRIERDEIYTLWDSRLAA